MISASPSLFGGLAGPSHGICSSASHSSRFHSKPPLASTTPCRAGNSTRTPSREARTPVTRPPEIISSRARPHPPAQRPPAQHDALAHPLLHQQLPPVGIAARDELLDLVAPQRRDA